MVGTFKFFIRNAYFGPKRKKNKKKFLVTLDVIFEFTTPDTVPVPMANEMEDKG